MSALSWGMSEDWLSALQIEALAQAVSLPGSRAVIGTSRWEASLNPALLSNVPLVRVAGLWVLFFSFLLCGSRYDCNTKGEF